MHKTNLPFRLLVEKKQSGSRNMAVDEALLLSMKNPCPPILRLYGFKPTCLSIGRFQNREDIKNNALLKKHNILLVRRPTGGKAVLHINEITYSIILSQNHIQPFTKRTAYRFSANLLIKLISSLGVHGNIYRNHTSRLDHADLQPQYSNSLDGNCYKHISEYEILGKKKLKLVGSAQTTTRFATLQHGSIPLSDKYGKIDSFLSAETPPSRIEIVSVESETGTLYTFRSAQKILYNTAIHELGMKISKLTEEEQLLAKKLEQTKYNQANWTSIK